MKKIKCNVCRTRFIPSKGKLYLTFEKTAPLSALTSPPGKTYECFDCPECGCQNTVGVRMTPIEPSREEETDG